MKRAYLFIFLAYFVIWLFPRANAVMQNVLFMDDYAFGVYDPELIYSKTRDLSLPPVSYRWSFELVAYSWANFLPQEYFLSNLPKLVSGIFLSLFALFTYRLLVGWKVPQLVSLIIPAILISHPTINEITLWNIAHPVTFWMFLVILGFLIIEDASSPVRILFGMICLTVAVMGYEIYFVIFLVLIIAEPIIKRLTGMAHDLRSTKRKLIIFLAIAGIYVLQVTATKAFFPFREGAVEEGMGGFDRGLTAFSHFTLSGYIITKLHGMSDLLVNAYMPLVSYYYDMITAMRKWEWIPITMALLTIVAAALNRRSKKDILLFGLFPLLLPLVPTLPTWFSKTTPEDWRVSVPVVFAACLALVPLFSFLCMAEIAEAAGARARISLRQWLLVVIAVFVVIAQSLVVQYEANLRVLSNRLDKEVTNKIIQYWETLNLTQKDYAVGILGDSGYYKGYIETKGYLDSSKELTAAYHKQDNIIRSQFTIPWGWRGYLSHNGFRVVELTETDHPVWINIINRGCKLKPYLCRIELANEIQERCKSEPDLVHEATGLRLAHFPERKLTAVCY